VHLDVQSATGYGTEDLSAYDGYLRGVHLWRLRTEESLLEAIESFQSAIDADPEFARAYVGIAGVYTVLADYSKADQDTTTRLANRYASYALALDPVSSQAFAVLGNSYNNFSDFEVAIVLYQRALALDPHNSSALMWLGLVYLQQGRSEEAIEILERAVALDPQYRVALSNLAYLRVVTGDIASAQREIEQLRVIDPNYNQIAGNVIGLGALTGDRALVMEGLRESARNKGGISTAWVEDLVAALEGRGDVAAVAAHLRATGARTWVDPADPNPLFQSEAVLTLELLGARALALDLLDDIIAGDPADARWGLYGEQMSAFRCEPRYRTQMRALGYDAMVETWDCD
jgi:tetratricopeptide (TPR) repeat protein